jgi:hypothetical protein
MAPPRPLPVLLLVLIAGPACVVPVRTPERHLIPEGYVGWVRTFYGVPDAPPLPVEDGCVLQRYPDSGRLETSSLRTQGLVRDEYYYVSGERRTRLPVSAPGGGGMIWGKHEGNITVHREGGVVRKTGQSRGFFVGSWAQYQEGRSIPRAGPPLPVESRPTRRQAPQPVL